MEKRVMICSRFVIISARNALLFCTTPEGKFSYICDRHPRRAKKSSN